MKSDTLFPIAVDEKELEMLLIGSINTLKPGNKKSGNEVVFNLVKDSIDGVIKKEVFDNLENILVQSQSIQRNKLGILECLPCPKETLKLSHKLLIFSQKSIDSNQATVKSSQLIEDSSQATVEILCSQTFTQSNFEGPLNLKVGLENRKFQIIEELKDLIFNEINFFKDSFLKSFVNKVSAN